MFDHSPYSVVSIIGLYHTVLLWHLIAWQNLQLSEICIDEDQRVGFTAPPTILIGG